MPGPEPETPLAETIHEASKEGRAALIFVIVMALVQLISVMIYTINASKDRAEDREQQNLNRQLKMIESLYDRQNKKYQEIEYPLTSMRVILNEINKICVEKDFTFAEKQKRLEALRKQRIKDKIALIQAFGASEILFGTELFENIKEIVAELDKTETLNDSQLCAVITPEYEEKIKTQNRKIDKSMHDAMKESEKDIRFIIDKEDFRKN